MSGDDGRVRVRDGADGRPELAFRAGTYESFLRRMLAAMPARTVEEDGAGTRPLERLDAQAPRNFAAALADAWATAGDVLTFYGERILNEGYLRTAADPLSLHELTAMLGFPLEPGVSAVTWLAFTVSPAPGAADVVTLPAGTAAQSIPPQGQKPQVFETSAPLDARPEWSAIPALPASETIPALVAVSDTSLRLAGTGTGLRAGSPLLVADPDGERWLFGTVSSAQPNAKAGFTLVEWTPAPAGTRGTGVFADPGAFSFGRTTRLFGHNAADWTSLSTESRRAYREILGGVFRWDAYAGSWIACNAGLPAVDVRALAADLEGNLWAATAGAGVYVSRDAGASWTAAGLARSDVHSLAVGPSGRIYAGMAGGRVSVSADGGGTWEAFSGTSTLQQSSSADTSPPEPALQTVSTRLPPSPVRALAVIPGPGGVGGEVVAGTDFGVFASPEASGAWVPWSQRLPSYDPASGRASVAVWSLFLEHAVEPWLGTDAGIFSADGVALSGIPAQVGDPPRPNVARALGWTGGRLLAGTDAGPFVDDGGHAAPYAEGLPLAPGGTPVPVRALADDGRTVYAATSAGVWARGPSDARWRPLGETDPPPPVTHVDDCGRPLPVPAPPGLNQVDVTALALTPAGDLFAAAPFAGFPVEAWPSPPVCDGVVYLDGATGAIVPGGWLVLQQAPDPALSSPPGDASPPAGGEVLPAVAVRRVTAVRTLPAYEAYGRRGPATEVVLDSGHGLDVFGVRTTAAFAASSALPLYQQVSPVLVPFTGATVGLVAPATPLPAQRTVAVTGSPIRAAVDAAAGVFAGGAAGWTPAGLAAVDAVAVAVDAAGALYASVAAPPSASVDPAAPVPGLHRSTDGGATWALATGFPDGATVIALAAGSGGAWAGTGAHGVFRSAGGTAWTRAGRHFPARAAVTCVLPTAAGTLAGTAGAGVFRLSSDGEWEGLSVGLGGAHVRALAAMPDGSVLAGTDAGVSRLAAGAASWTDESAGLDGAAAAALAVLPSGAAFAGTKGGVFSLSARGEWVAASSALPQGPARDVAALAATADGTLWAATRGAGCWSSADAGATWRQAPTGALNDVRCAAAAGARVVVGCGAVPLLFDAGARPRPGPAPQGIVAIDPAWAFDLDRGFLAPTLLSLLAGGGATLGPTSQVQVRTPGSAWQINTPPSGGKPAPDPVLMLRLDAGAIRVRRPIGLLTVTSVAALGESAGSAGSTASTGSTGSTGSMTGSMTSTGSTGSTDPDSAVGVVGAKGNTAQLTPRKDELVWQPADAEAAPVSEIARVAGSVTVAGSATVTLAEPLANVYDPSTVTVAANVARATHGASVAPDSRPEVLGSGNGARNNQTFALGRPPLTFVPGDTPSAGTPALRVRVNGVEWTRVDTLYGTGPADAAYELRVDQTGAAAVTFGDGTHGARLPTGSQNVTAVYRAGVGPAGNVDAFTVRVLKSAALGTRTVTNPVPATGGLAGQTLDEARETAPVRARTLQRVVSLSDYEDFALAFPGVGQAVSRLVPDAHGGVVALTVGGLASPDDAVDDVVQDLTRAIASAGGSARRFRVLPCEAVGVVARATVHVDPRYDADLVRAAAESALAAWLSYGERTLGEPIAASDVVTLLQGIAGVAGVVLEALHPRGGSRMVEPVIHALPARWDAAAGQLRSAQILVGAPDGVSVQSAGGG